jgi:hypothetical protein
MSRGYLSGESVRPMSAANIVWSDAEHDVSFELTSAGGWAWSKSPRIPGFLCEPCGVIELHFEIEPALDEEPVPTGKRLPP